MLSGFLLADDLTGACDSGAVFARQGWTSAVWLRGPAPTADLLIRSTASRDVPAAEAAARVDQACDGLSLAGIPFLYKKVDSVLRGNIAAEVEAVMRRAGRPGLFCPAFPEQGRVFSNRAVWTGDKRIQCPVLPEGVEIRDAATRVDLDAVAAEALARDPKPVMIGSAGLAGSVAALLGKPSKKTPFPLPPAIPTLCIGSLHPVTLAQLEWVQVNRREKFRLVRIETSCPEFEPTGALFLCGGDTAAMVCERLQVDHIVLAGEIAPGVPIGRIVGGVADGRPVITKSGGFGVVDILGEVVDVLSGDRWRELP